MKTAAVIIGAIALFVLIGWAVVVDEQQWETYSVSHHCRKVATREQQLIPMVSTDGNTSFIIPESNTYVCDGGETVTR